MTTTATWSEFPLLQLVTIDSQAVAGLLWEELISTLSVPTTIKTNQARKNKTDSSAMWRPSWMSDSRGVSL